MDGRSEKKDRVILSVAVYLGGGVYGGVYVAEECVLSLAKPSGSYAKVKTMTSCLLFCFQVRQENDPAVEVPQGSSRSPLQELLAGQP